MRDFVFENKTKVYFGKEQLLVRSSCVTCMRKWHVSVSAFCWSMAAAASRESAYTIR